MLTLKIITPTETCLEDQVNAIMADGIEGQMTIFPHHSLLLTQLKKKSTLTIMKNTQKTHFQIEEATLKVSDNTAILICESLQAS